MLQNQDTLRLAESSRWHQTSLFTIYSMARILVILGLMHFMGTFEASGKVCLGTRKARINLLHNSTFLRSRQLQTSVDDFTRAVAPWTYRIDSDHDRVPQNLRFAECLYEGCIIHGIEDKSYNSIMVFQTQIVLKRIPCPLQEKKYYLEVQHISVPVACVCVVPRIVGSI
uniref:Interleukin-17C n=1 Tax=Denticeps clupeoides TaxID=299321 RepID=A0AAY4BUN0_9TELE